MSEGFRISSMNAQEQVKRTVNNVNGELSRLTKQITSGQKADSFIGLSDKVSTEEFISVKNAVNAMAARSRNNALLQNKLSEYDNAATNLQSIASRTKLLIQQAKDPVSGSAVDVIPLAKNLLNEAKSYLNTQFNGQYIFAGSKVNVPPIGDIENNTNIVLDNPTSNYYMGDEVVTSSRISEETFLEYGIKADDSSFQKLIGSLHQVIEARTFGDESKYNDAITWAEESSKGLSMMLSKVGSSMEAIESHLKIDEQSALRMKDFLSNIEDTDIPEAMGELMAVQAQMQAAYMLLTKINSTSLADYMR
jgi:flagellar hook-associated protein 3 FlgL